MAFQPVSSGTPELRPRELTEAEKRKREESQKISEQKIALEEERAYRKGVVTVLDLIAPAAFEVKPSYLRLGDRYVSTMFVMTYPRYVTIGWSAPIINMNTALDISMYFYPIKSDIVLKQLQKKVGVLEAQIIADEEKGMARDPVRETALKDVERLRDDLTQGTEHFFQFAFYVTFYADSMENLTKVATEIDVVFGTKLIFAKRVLYQAEQGFNSTMPLANDEILVSFNMNSSPIASSFPFISSELTSDDGVLYGINRHNNSLIIFDRFSLQNANIVVFATSGAGKSYAVKLEVLRALMLGTDIIIIDPEKEYKHLSDAVGGTYIDISLSSESKVNPFDLPKPTADSNLSSEDIIRSAVIALKGMLRIMLGQTGEKGQVQLTSEEDSILDRALLEAYAKKDIVAGADISNIEPPIMQDLLEVLEGMEGAEELTNRLRKFTEGTFAGLINSPTTVNINNQLVVFSVRDLEDELRPIAIYAVVNFIWNTIRSEKKKRILVIDEAWWLMQHEDSAKFIFALVKRCRKYYLGITTISQDVNDFLLSPYGQAIVTNSSMQLLLRQSPASIDLVQKTFLLTQGEKYLLLEAGVGEGIFFAGNKHAAIKVVSSYTEDQLITTDPKQMIAIEEEKAEYKRQLDEIDK
jgi:type IV secretory pathway VirB4 component